MNPTETLILVVEDDPAIAELLATVLNDNGYQVLMASSADEAMKHLAEIRPAAMTLDAGLPGISGPTLLQLIRENEATRDLPVIMISALPQLEQEVEGSVQAFIRKPFALDEVLATVRELAGPGREPPDC